MKSFKRIIVFQLSVFLIAGQCACGTIRADASAGTGSSAETQMQASDQMPGEMPPDGNGGPGGAPPDGNGGPGGTPPDGNGDPGGASPDGNGGPGGMPPDGNGGPGGGPGGMSADIEYSGATEIAAADTQTGQSYASDTTDENALLIDASDEVTIADPSVTKTGDSDGGDSCSFFGVNSAVLVKDGAEANITGGTITTDAEGANGVFCYGGNGGQNGADGDGTTVVIRDTAITTTGGGSGGIMTTGGGITYAYDLDVTTGGRSSAPIRTDRGGGTVYVDGGTYTSNGLGSPAIYSTAEIGRDLHRRPEFR